MSLLKRAWAALVAFLRGSAGPGLGDASAVENDLRAHLAASMEAHRAEVASLTAVIAEKDRQIQELLDDLATCNEPGAVLRRWNERVRRAEGDSPAGPAAGG